MRYSRKALNVGIFFGIIAMIATLWAAITMPHFKPHTEKVTIGNVGQFIAYQGETNNGLIKAYVDDSDYPSYFQIGQKTPYTDEYVSGYITITKANSSEVIANVDLQKSFGGYAEDYFSVIVAPIFVGAIATLFAQYLLEKSKKRNIIIKKTT